MNRVQEWWERVKFEIRLRKVELKEAFWRKLSHRLPRVLVYHAAIRLGAEASTGKYSYQLVPEMTFLDALNRWRENDSEGNKPPPSTITHPHLGKGEEGGKLSPYPVGDSRRYDSPSEVR